MHQYKIITRILLILPIINFAFALPIAEQETRQVCADVVPDGATRVAMLAKSGDEVENGMYFEKLSGKSDSDLADSKHFNMKRLTMGRWNLLKWARARFNRCRRSCRNLRPRRP